MRTFLTVFFGGLVGVLVLGLLRIGGFGIELDKIVWQALGRTPFSTAVTSNGSLLVGIALSFALAWVAVDVPRGSQRWVLGLLTVLLLGTGTLVLAVYNIMFSPISPIVGTIFGLASTTLLTRIGPGAYRRRVDEIFGNSVSRKSLRALYNGSTTAVTTTKQCKVTVLVFETIRHEELMLVMSPQDFAAMSRMYLSFVSDYLCGVGALIESSSGSQVRAVFGVPTQVEHSAQMACRAALEVAQRLGRLNLESDSRWHQMLGFHIGIATGEVIAGVFGSPRSLPYAIAGGPVKFAVKLAQACEIYGSSILMCMDTQREAEEILEMRPIDIIQTRGGLDSEIYELLCLKGGLSADAKRSRDHFWTGVNHTRSSRWEEAIEEFSQSRVKGIPDAPLDYYLQRIERERKAEAKNRPRVVKPI